MSYIKIYPKSLSLLNSEPHTLSGSVIYDIEQYGQLHPRQSFEIQILPSSKPNSWSITSVNDHPAIKNFDSFLKALNYYVFQNLKIQLPQVDESGLYPPFEVGLREVYFALDPDSPSAAPNYFWGEIKRD